MGGEPLPDGTVIHWANTCDDQTPFVVANNPLCQVTGASVGGREYATCGEGATCGNGIIEGAEECDDGNTASGDGCSSTCETEGGTDISCCSTAGICEVVVPGLTTCAEGVMFSGTVCDDTCGSPPPSPADQYCCAMDRTCKPLVAGEINTCYPGTTTGDPACGDVCSGLPPLPNSLFCCSTAGSCEQVVPGLTTCGEGGVYANPDCGGTCGSPPPPADQYCCAMDRTCKPLVAGEINTCYPGTTTGDPACGDVCSGLPPLPNSLFCCSTAGSCEQVVPGLTTCGEGVMFAESACGTGCREVSSEDAFSSAPIGPEDRLVCCSTADVCEPVYPGLTTCKEGVVFRGSCGTACAPPADTDTESYCCEPGVQPDENCRPFLPATGPACVAGGACDCESCVENCAPDECPV